MEKLVHDETGMKNTWKGVDAKKTGKDRIGQEYPVQDKIGQH